LGRDWKSSELTGIRVLARTSSGRVKNLELEWSLPGVRRLLASTRQAGVLSDVPTKKVTLSGVDLREALGAALLKSTWFEVQNEGGWGSLRKWRFQGRGFGHGAGLCQWGAKELGEKGESHEKILRHYYPKAALIQFW
jgi:stage II sporulation protein D